MQVLTLQQAIYAAGGRRPEVDADGGTGLAPPMPEPIDGPVPPFRPMRPTEP